MTRVYLQSSPSSMRPRGSVACHVSAEPASTVQSPDARTVRDLNAWVQVDGAAVVVVAAVPVIEVIGALVVVVVRLQGPLAQLVTSRSEVSCGGFMLGLKMKRTAPWASVVVRQSGPL